MTHLKRRSDQFSIRLSVLSLTHSNGGVKRPNRFEDIPFSVIAGFQSTLHFVSCRVGVLKPDIPLRPFQMGVVPEQTVQHPQP